LACFSDRAECAEALLEAGCDTTIVNEGGRTGWEEAVKQGSTSVLRLAVRLGAGTGSGHLPGSQPEVAQDGANVDAEPESLTEKEAAGRAVKNRRKKERRKQKKREEHELASQPEAGPELEPMLEPEPHPQPELEAAEQLEDAHQMSDQMLMLALYDESPEDAGRALQQRQLFDGIALSDSVTVARLELEAAEPEQLNDDVAHVYSRDQSAMLALYDESPEDAERALKQRQLFDGIALSDSATVARLLAAGADPNAPDLPRATPFMWTGCAPLVQAVAGGHLEIVQLLLQSWPRGTADVNAGHIATERQLPPLTVAASHGWSAILELLLDRGAAVDTVSAAGRTAFHQACAKDQMGCAVHLVRAGCDVTIRDKAHGNTARELAEANGCTGVLQWMAEMDAEAVATQETARAVKNRRKKERRKQKKREAAEERELELEPQMETAPELEPEPQPQPEEVEPGQLGNEEVALALGFLQHLSACPEHEMGQSRDTVHEPQTAETEPSSLEHLEPELEPEPEPGPELEPELNAPSGPMAEFDGAAVQSWLRLVPGLTAAQRAATAEIMADDEYEGAELAIVKPKTLARLLKGSDAEEAVPPLLAARDAYRAAEQAAGEQATKEQAARQQAAAEQAAAEQRGASAAPGCPICLEPYSQAGGVVPLAIGRRVI
jgi:ankyrin repeat protein